MSKSISKNALFNAILNLFNIIFPVLVLTVVSVAIGNELYGYMDIWDMEILYIITF